MRLGLSMTTAMMLAFSATGCQVDTPPVSAPTAASNAAKKTLYERLGKEPAITAVVEEFVARAAPDPKVNFTRDGQYLNKPGEVERLKRLLVAQIVEVSGGPKNYAKSGGRDMKSSHAGMKITEEQFNALAGHLVESLKKFKVPQPEIDELVGIIATTKKDIVEG